MLVTLRNTEGQTVMVTYETPTVANCIFSSVVGLVKNVAHVSGPGDYDFVKRLPHGAQRFQCTMAPSGPLVLPFAELQTAQATQQL